MKVKRRKRYRLRKGGFLWRLTRITPYICLAGFLVFAAQFGGARTETALAVELPQPIEYKLVDLPELPPKYDVPLDDDLVLHIIDIADINNIDPELILAIIKQESNFDASAMGDNGHSYGLMQVQKRYHEERMQRLYCTDLLNPYENIIVGADIISQKLRSGKGLEWALMAYNGGNPYADNMLQDGKISEYAQNVIQYYNEYKGIS